MSRCATGVMMGETERRTSQISQQGVLDRCEVRMGSKSKYLIEGKPIIKSMVTSLQTMARRNKSFASMSLPVLNDMVRFMMH